MGVVLGCQSQTTPTLVEIDKAYVKEHLLGKKVQLVDVRTAEEYNAGHIEGAINFNIAQKDTFLQQLKTLNKDEAVYLYCKAGGRSNRAAKVLGEEGFMKIYDYSGGYDDWVKN